MEKEKATVWVTKYALTNGLEFVNGEVYTFDNGNVYFEYRSRSCTPKQWHRTKEEAIARAEEMRKAKIASLKKQLEKLENLRFE